MKIDLIIAGRRLRNRILDLVGRLLGYCMASTWRDETDDHGPGYTGYAHWRCWVRRSAHRRTHGPNLFHRYRAYRWRPAGTTEFVPVDALDPRAAREPWWARRFPHMLVPTRRQQRLVTEYAERQAAARRAQRVAAERAGRSPIMCVHGVAARDCPICSPPRRVQVVRGRRSGSDDLMNLADAVADTRVRCNCDGEWWGGEHVSDCPPYQTPGIPTQRKDEPK